MEILDLYDKNGKLLNKTIERGNKNFGENEYIKLATIWLKCKDKYLIQKTSKEKGGEYAVSGGHVQSGKTSAEQALLELQEELNLNIDIKQLKLLGNICGKNAIFDVYFVEDDKLDKTKFILQKEEVESVEWLSTEEIKQLINDNKMRKSTIAQFEQFIDHPNLTK